MTMPVAERVARVEAQVESLSGDVGEVKTDLKEVKHDVKTLLLRGASGDGVWSVISKAAPWAAIALAAIALITR